jgi:hypothetical protein
MTLKQVNKFVLCRDQFVQFGNVYLQRLDKSFLGVDFLSCSAFVTKRLRSFLPGILLCLLACSAFSTPSQAAEVDIFCQTGTATGGNAGWVPCAAGNPMAVAPAAYPAGVTPIVAVGTGSTSAVTATLAASATLKTYICSVDVSALGTLAVGPITITNVAGSTFTYQLTATASGNLFTRTFTPCVPTSAVNTSMVITTTADGSATAVDINATGYQGP